MNIASLIEETPLSSQWRKIGISHHHGLSLPLSSLHTAKSCGIGEFYDLIPLINWCASLNLDVVQLLPLNDTGDETSPFFSLSSMALNPLFLSLDPIPGIKKGQLKELRQLSCLPRVAYHDVQSHKLLLLRHYFEEEGYKWVKKKAFTHFVCENEWVESYALFKVLKDIMAKNHWERWPCELKHFDLLMKESLIKKHWTDVCFYVFLQFLCFEQLTHVKAHAHKKRVLLKGDIPILISGDSADVWEYPDAFNLDLSAGAPPDVYNQEGQVWGLPIYNWDVMKERHFAWWRRRLRVASRFYDIYRIDHVLGFFRIFAIGQGKLAKEGHFIPENEADWLEHGKGILSALIDHSSILPIAEDLGTVPNSVRTTLSSMGICGTKVIRWERDHERYFDPLHYHPLSMTTVSTHDSPTLTQWWSEEQEASRLFAKQKRWAFTKDLSQPHRREILWDSHHSSSLFHINLIGEYLALFPELTWENPKDERINIPGTISPNNWTYRIRPTLEEIVSHKPLAQKITEIIS